MPQWASQILQKVTFCSTATGAVYGQTETITVLRALRTLRDEGLLEFRRGRGISVAGTTSQSEVLARTKELVDFARSRGYRRDELVQVIDRVA